MPADRVANPVKGEVLLTLEDGRTFTLVMNFSAFVAAEAVYRQPLPLIAVDAAMGFVSAMGAMLFGALRAYHPEITAEEAGEWCLLEHDRVKAALEAADKASYPEAAEDKKPGKAPSRQRGKNSGGNGAKSVSTRKASGSTRRAPSP